MSDHVHKFNATLIRGNGRCTCGAWARYDRSTKSYGPPLGSSYSKGLETRLARAKDPNFEYPRDPEFKRSDDHPFTEEERRLEAEKVFEKKLRGGGE